MHFSIRAAGAMCSAVLLAGCSSLITGGELLRPGEPTGVIEIVNATSNAVNVVLISECAASTYGLNRLAEGSAIYPGESATFEVSAGCWDVDAGTIGYGEARQRMQVDAGGGVRYIVEG